MTANFRGSKSEPGSGDPHPCGAMGLSPHPAMIELARLLARLLAREAADGKSAVSAMTVANTTIDSPDSQSTHDHSKVQHDGR